MNNKKASFLFISTNNIWSGSEELWFAAAENLQDHGYTVITSVNYEYEKNNSIKNKLTYSVKSKSYRHLLKRIKRKFFKITKLDFLYNEINKINPSLIIISQGGNLASLDIMELCVNLDIKFVTLTQLVTKVHLLSLDNQSYPRFLIAYQKAKKNYFVSKNNINLHKLMLGYNSNNNELVYNPFRLNKKDIPYPKIENGYQIAFVGRIEFFHKGIDLLLEVLNLPKWKNRDIVFNFYGNGPHEVLLKQTLIEFKIYNCFLHGYKEDINEIWALNHALILPSRMEGQSLSLIEALLNERLAIVTNVGGACEIIENNLTGFVSQDVSVFAIDDALERAWQKKTDWEAMGKLAKQFAQEKMPDDAVGFFSNKLIELLN